MSLNSTWVGILFSFITLVGTPGARANSGVGNGGTLFNAYLESVRTAMIQGLVLLGDEPAEQAGICKDQHLSMDQEKECRDFLLDTRFLIQALSSQKTPVPFAIKDEPLIVTGPDGKPLFVDALTSLGPDDAIEFSYPRTHQYSPQQLLTLMIHEFGHKVLFRSLYVEDNLPTHTFSTGRNFLDAVGFAFSSYVLKNRIITKDFRYFDTISCEFLDTSHDIPLYKGGGLIARDRIDAGSFMKFETRISPADDAGMTFCVGLHDRSGWICLNAAFHEEGGCQIDLKQGRWTKLEILQMSLKSAKEAPPPVVLVSETHEGVNPICPDSDPVVRVQFKNYQIECKYKGTIVGGQ